MTPSRQPSEPSEPHFEVFKKRTMARSKQPVLTIQKGGTMSLNKAAYLALREPKAVELLYDSSAKIIGLRSVLPTELHAYPVRAVGRLGNTYALAGRAFCTYYDIPTTQAQRIKARLLDNSNVLAADMSDAEPVG
jgi:hypothetical protein